MGALLQPGEESPLITLNEEGRSPYVLICEHASRLLPQKLGSLGLPAHELERHTGLSYVQVDRRMHELVKRQEAKATTSKRQTPTGGQALVWEAV